MGHHARSGIAIVFALGVLGFSWFVGHRPADWEYIFLMFVVFSSALQDAMDDLNHKLEKLTRIVEEFRRNADYLKRDIQQETEYLKSHITGEANNVKSDLALLKYEFALATALQKGEDPPEAPEFVPPYPEPKFVPIEPPKIEPFDAVKFRAEGLSNVADALRGHVWWDMSVVTSPLRRLLGYIATRTAFIRWITND
jgi:hypothetical protein